MQRLLEKDHFLSVISPTLRATAQQVARFELYYQPLVHKLKQVNHPLPLAIKRQITSVNRKKKKNSCVMYINLFLL